MGGKLRLTGLRMRQRGNHNYIQVFKHKLSLHISSDMPKRNGQTEILLALGRIEDQLQQILNVLQVSARVAIEDAKKRVLSSTVTSSVYNLCDGKHSVNGISATLGKSS